MKQCINNAGVKIYLTNGELYEVIKETPNFLYIKDNTFKTNKYTKDRFK